MVSTQLKLALLTNHPISVPLIVALSEVGMPVEVASFDEGDIIAEMLQSQGVDIAVSDLGLSGSWEDDFSNWLEGNAANMLAVFSWPKLIPEDFLDRFPHGAWNFHIGILPKYRGPDSVFWQIVNGEQVGALTVHEMSAEFDTGRVFQAFQSRLDGKTYGEHLEELGKLAPNAMAQLIKAISSGSIESKLIIQDREEAASWTKPELTDTLIHWDRHTAIEIERLVLACNPQYGGAKALISEQVMQVYSVAVSGQRLEQKPGTIFIEANGELRAVCADGSILVLNVIGDATGIFFAADWARSKGH